MRTRHEDLCGILRIFATGALKTCHLQFMACFILLFRAHFLAFDLRRAQESEEDPLPTGIGYSF